MAKWKERERERESCIEQPRQLILPSLCVGDINVYVSAMLFMPFI